MSKPAKARTQKILTTLKIKPSDPDRFAKATIDRIKGLPLDYQLGKSNQLGSFRSSDATKPSHPREEQIADEQRAWSALIAAEGRPQLAVTEEEIRAFIRGSSSTFEAWQYLGVEDGCWTFRHRHHPVSGRREYRQLPVR